MRRNEHTPGPWIIYPETDGTEICAVDLVYKLPVRQIIARPVRGENWIANAGLIAAAPAMYAELWHQWDALQAQWKWVSLSAADSVRMERIGKLLAAIAEGGAE
jgi:hypothetical protein